MKIHYLKAKPISYGTERPYSAVRYVVFHYTGNDGDTAKGNASYFARYGDGNTRNAGAHFFVSQNGDIWKSVPMKLTAWAVGGFVTNRDGAAQYYQKCTNTNSISIELCDNASRDPSAEQIKACKDLLKYIRNKCPNAQTVLRHWDVSGKSCPARMTGKDNVKWKNFKKAIGAKAAETTTVKKIAYPNCTLRYGNEGAEVKKLQRCLNQIMGTDLAVDGQFGTQTLKAVRDFQQKYKLEVDGTVGPKTRAKIKSLILK